MKQTQNSQSIVTEIVIRPPVRKQYDIGDWRTAFRSADYDRMVPLYNLYDDLLIDGILTDSVGKRIRAVTNSELTFQDKKGKEVEEIATIIDTLAFETLLTTIMNRKFWGRSGGEFDFRDGFDFKPIPPKHIKLSNHNILYHEYDEEGFDYTTDEMLLVIGETRDFGLFLKTAPLVIWKRGGFGDYAQWIELFGMPQRIGKYSSFDATSRQILVKALEQAGSAPYVVVPKETDIETVNNTGTGSSGTAHNDFRKACNEEMVITMVGQTLTTMQGDKGARSLGEVHKDVEEGINRSDLRFVQRILNTYVVPLLEKRGFKTKGGSFVFPKAAEPLSVQDIVSLSKVMKIPAKWAHEKYSIPTPNEGEEILGSSSNPVPAPPDPNNPNPPDPNNPPPPPVSPNDKNGKQPPLTKRNIKNEDEQSFWERVWDFFVKAPAMTGASNGSLLTLSDNTLNDRLIKQVANGDLSFNPELFNFLSHDFLKALDDKAVNLGDWGFAYDYQNDAFRTAQEMNLFQFSAAKSIAEIQMLNELYRKSSNFNEFYQAAKSKLDVFNKGWQRTEWQTAGLIAASTQNYQRLASKTKLFPYWEYKTAGDGRVRPWHEKLAGVILPANDPRWNKIWPPNGWKCRCYIVPRLAGEVEGIDIEAMRARVDAVLETTEWQAAARDGFGVNRAKNPELFTKNQMYLEKFPGMAVKKLEDINYHTYGLDSYEAARKKATSATHKYNDTLDAFLKGLPKDNGLNYFTDYNGRKVIFDTKDWLAGHKGKEAARALYLISMQETLALPDEVWLNGDQLNQYVFLKYYTDEVMAVIAQIENESYQIKTWFPVSETSGSKIKSKQKKHKYAYRWGMLIKKPGT